jgi:hypothetical protein
LKKHKRLFTDTLFHICKIFVILAVLCSTLVFPQSVRGDSYHRLDITVSSESVTSDGETELVPVITLKWPDNLSSSYRYYIERKKDLGSFSVISSLKASESDSSSDDEAAYTDDDSLADDHLYTYRISYRKSSSSSEDDTSVYTEEVSVVYQILTAPDSLTVTAVASDTLKLNWTYPEEAGNGTVIERKEDSDGEWVELETVSSGITSYSDTDLSSETEYFYRVKAKQKDHVYSVAYPEDGISKYTGLSTPGDLSGYALSPTQIYLTWTDSDDENAYTLQRKEAGYGDFSEVATLSEDTSSYIDTGLTSDTIYVYRIKAQNGSSTSEYSTECAVACVYVEKPTELTASLLSDSEVKLGWEDNSNDETAFEIWRKAGQKADWTKYASAYRNSDSFTDEDISAENTYYYKVRARISDSNAYSSFSNEAYAWVSTITPPSDLNYSISGSTMKLTWKDNSNNESGFAIESRTGVDGGWYTAAWPSANTTGTSISAPAKGDLYFYRVKAFDSTSSNAAGYSDEICVNTVIPDPPSDLMLVRVSYNQVKLVWTDNSNSESGFIVERKSGTLSSADFRQIATTKSNAGAYIDTGLSANVKYTYRVCATNSTGVSKYSNEEEIMAGNYITFSDITGLKWAKTGIESLAGRGVFKAAADGKFHPYEKITRGEFISVIVKAFNFKGTAVGSFHDVNPRHKYYTEIMTANKNGIADGENGYFYPDRLISRQDLAVFLVRALNAAGEPIPYHNASILEEYSDYGSISSYALGSFAALRGENLINGRKLADDKWLIAPLDNTTRAEAAVLVYRVLNR